MKIIGITGAAAAGKTLVSQILEAHGIRVWNADNAVHGWFLNPSIIQKIQRHFPEVVKKNTIDRVALAEHVFSSKAKLKRLEKIMHPLVRVDAKNFMQMHRRQHSFCVGLDVPLLFEGNYNRFCDRILLVSSPFYVRRNRLLKRGVNEIRLLAMERRAMRFLKRRKLVDGIIISALGKNDVRRKIFGFLKQQGIK